MITTGAWLQGTFDLQSSKKAARGDGLGLYHLQRRGELQCLLMRAKLEGSAAQCTSKVHASRWHRKTINPSALLPPALQQSFTPLDSIALDAIHRKCNHCVSLCSFLLQHENTSAPFIYILLPCCGKDANSYL